MNDKNIKKQHAAQALGEDSLENVSGGYSSINGFSSNMLKGLRLSDAERECLREDSSWREKVLDKVSPEAYKQAIFQAKIECLRRHGFHAE